MKEKLVDAENFQLTGYGFCMSDIREFGFDAWLSLPHEYVVESFLETTHEVSNVLMEDLRTILNQEKTLDELGIEQSMKVDMAGLVEALNRGLLDVFKAMQFYFQLQTEANALYHAHQN